MGDDPKFARKDTQQPRRLKREELKRQIKLIQKIRETPRTSRPFSAGASAKPLCRLIKVEAIRCLDSASTPTFGHPSPWVLGYFFLARCLQEELLRRHLECRMNALGIVVMHVSTDRFDQLFNGGKMLSFAKLKCECTDKGFLSAIVPGFSFG